MFALMVILSFYSSWLLGYHNPCIIFLIHSIQEIDPELILTINSLRGK